MSTPTPEVLNASGLQENPKYPTHFWVPPSSADPHLLTLRDEQTEAQRGVTEGTCSASGKIGSRTKISTALVYFLP